MRRKCFDSGQGRIHYWIAPEAEKTDIQLVFLPGLTADHRLFTKQIRFFLGKYPVLVWDAPGHAFSWPFDMDFSMMDQTKWLDDILEENGFGSPVIIGQSMGGYIGQMYAQLFPGKLKGFVAIDSAPLNRKYYTGAELWLLKRMEPVYRHYPWKLLLKQGSQGVAETAYGRRLMRRMMMTYDGEQERYALLAGAGYSMLADAVEADISYEIRCPAMLICGRKDHAGSCKQYARAWNKQTGIPLRWIEGAGHNANTDNPDEVNRLISDFVLRIE